LIVRGRGFAAAISTAALLMAGCSGGSATPATSPSITIVIPSGSSASRPASATEVRGWAANWCQAQPGISKAQLIAIMGKPTSDFSAESSSWDGYEWQFNAFYDANGNVRQLDINDYRLTAADKATITCDTTRVAT